MALFQRGKKGIFWYEFVVHGRRYRESTGTTSERIAEKIEAAQRQTEEHVGNGTLSTWEKRDLLVRVRRSRPPLSRIHWHHVRTDSREDRGGATTNGGARREWHSFNVGKKGSSGTSSSFTAA